MKSDSKLLTAVGLYHFANDGSLAVLPLVLPVIKLKFNLSYTDIGILTGVGLIVTLLVQILVSELANRFRAVRVLTLGMTTMLLFSAMMVFVWNYASLLVFVIGMRIGAAAYHPLGLALVAKRFGNGDIDMAMGVQSSSGDLGVLLAFLTTGALGVIFDWQSSFALWGGICLAAAVVGISFKIGTDESSPCEILVRDAELSWSDAFHRIGILIIPLTVGGAGYNILVNYAPLMLQAIYNLEIGQYALIIALWVGTGATFTLIFGRISTKFGRGRAIILSYILVLLSGLLILFTTNLAITILAMFLYGVGLFMTYPALFAYVTESTGGKRSERAFGIVFTCQLSGGFVASYLSGVLSDAYNIRMPFLLLSIIAAIALCVTSYYLVKLRSRPST